MSLSLAIYLSTYLVVYGEKGSGAGVWGFVGGLNEVYEGGVMFFVVLCCFILFGVYLLFFLTYESLCLNHSLIYKNVQYK